jgi:hypothetical protein
MVIAAYILRIVIALGIVIALRIANGLRIVNELRVVKELDNRNSHFDRESSSSNLLSSPGGGVVRGTKD